MKKITYLISVIICTGLCSICRSQIHYTNSEDSTLIVKAREAYLGKNYSLAFKLFMESANKFQNSFAEYSIATMYDIGDGVPENDVEATKWYTRSADHGNHYCQLLAGQRYMDGEGCDTNNALAFKYLILAANNGFSDAQLRIGQMYLEGIGTIADANEAANWFQKAAKEGSLEAKFHLGFLYLEKKVPELQKNEGLRLVTEAAEGGLAQAQFNLGRIYEVGDFSLPKNIKLCIEWYEKAAIQHFPDAEYNLGTLYADGIEVPADYQKAFKWLNLAAQDGLGAFAYNSLAVLYADGKGFPQNDSIALYYFRLSAISGNQTGFENLVLMYSLKRGMQPHEAGITNLGLEFWDGKKGMPKDHEIAAYLFYQAALQDDAKACWLLGRCAENGDGIEKDLNFAKECYTRAVSLGADYASKDLERLNK